jgi:ribose transport system permease protein
MSTPALKTSIIPLSLFQLPRDDRPIAIAALFIIAILVAGTSYTLWKFGSAPLLSPNYLMQQLQVGSFLGVVAAGMMVVILLGHIDLSVPWTLAAAAMMATAVGGAWAIPAGLGVGLLVGIINGIGVAYLRVPSMIFTLGVNAVMRGLMVWHTGGFAPQTAATDLMRFLAAERSYGIPHAIFVWAAVSVVVIVILQRTALGRYVYAIGNKEAAAYLAGVATRRVILTAFVLCSLTTSVAGVLLAGYSTKAYQGMGDAYLLPAIAAVVIGGTNILGGRGRYLGTLVGVILIVLLNSVLSIMEMPEAGRQIIYGLVIISMLLVYGRGERVMS